MVDLFSHAVLLLQQPFTNFSAILTLGSRLNVFLARQLLCWGTRPPIPSLLIIFLGFFFQSDRPTQHQETHSTVNEEKKKGGDGLRRPSGYR